MKIGLAQQMSKGFPDNQSQPSSQLGAGGTLRIGRASLDLRAHSLQHSNCHHYLWTHFFELILPSVSFMWVLTTSQEKFQALCDAFCSKYHFKTPAHIWMLPLTVFTPLGDDLTQVYCKPETLALMGFFSLAIVWKKSGMLFGLPWC